MSEYSVAIDRLLRRPEVEALTGLARATIYQKMAAGHFPRPVKIGIRAVAWPLPVIADPSLPTSLRHRPPLELL